MGHGVWLQLNSTPKMRFAVRFYLQNPTMRLSTVTRSRRCLCYYSSSHSLLISSDRHDRSDYTPRRSSELYWHSSLTCSSFPRRFSTQSAAFQPAEQFLPVQTLISLLDSYHHATGLPWWIIICSSTVAMRLAIFPLIVLQIKKMRIIGELLPHLPPPIPPPLSGRSFRDQFALFWKEKEAADCPSVFWFFSSVAVQVPCFFLWLMSVRKMSLDHHLGFDTGGTLWFQNLIEYPHGALGLLFPFCIAGLHVVNVQLSFAKSPLQQLPGSLGSLAKGYKNYLLILTLPLLTATFSIPQGSLVHWLSNSTLTLIQQLCLRNPTLLMYLGVPKVNTPVEVPTIKKDGSSQTADIAIMTKEGEVHAHTLSPVELVNYSIKVLSTGREDIAIICLRLALEKDPGFVKAMLILGQTLLKNKQFVEAAELFETAISKLLVDGDPTEVEDIDLLILVSQWAGIANVQQGKMEQGLVHLERIARIKEPEDSKSKAHYYDGFLVLSSALANVGREDEALKYLQMAAAYDPSYSVYIEHLKNDSEKPSSDPSNIIK
ncbi:ALBINO3-like protein 2, chloroplastic isoform X2 [Salvia splendens]|uniref:ALBINO3-like protein 2, chloroplastic isoform X2 n=1 Tax=Salvia splendens TaxID=180675 RepID=UPI001C256852|nr:ALBINO3-like protein 2, chloroplastic isoform X2 [Salvia splendens]